MYKRLDIKAFETWSLMKIIQYIVIDLNKLMK